jgi:hypothetical protein
VYVCVYVYVWRNNEYGSVTMRFRPPGLWIV